MTRPQATVNKKLFRPIAIPVHTLRHRRTLRRFVPGSTAMKRSSSPQHIAHGLFHFFRFVIGRIGPAAAWQARPEPSAPSIRCYARARRGSRGWCPASTSNRVWIASPRSRRVRFPSLAANGFLRTRDGDDCVAVIESNRPTRCLTLDLISVLDAAAQPGQTGSPGRRESRGLVASRVLPWFRSPPR